MSLYNLLQDHSKFEITKCFNWQASNTIGLFNNEENNAEALIGSSTILSFENENLVKKYAYKESLDYSYFVKQGRPFFAYHYFISDQLNRFGKTNKTL